MDKSRLRLINSLFSAGNQRSISYKILFYILLFSSSVTLIVTVYQLYSYYQEQSELVEQRMEQIEHSYSDSLSNAIWDLNALQIESILAGIMKFEDVHYVSVKVENGDTYHLGEKRQNVKLLHHNVEVWHKAQEQRIHVGHLSIESNLEGVIQRLSKQFWLILISQALKTFFVSIFILFIIYFLITRHLTKLANYTSSISFDKQALSSPLILDKARPKTDKSDELDQVVNAINDMQTQLIATIDELQKLTSAVDASSSAIIMTDSEGNIEYINSKFTETTDYTSEEVIGENIRLLQSEDTPLPVYVDMWEVILDGRESREWKGVFQNRKKGGELYWVRSSITCVRDSNDDITHFISIQDDVTHEHELNEKLSYQTSHDELTGLINRREFERRAERLFSTIRLYKGKHALCYLDLDQFKVVNDTCGHIAGDELLRQLSHELKNTVRYRDTLARLGGDEFAVLIEHCSLEDAHRVAVAIQKTIQKYQFNWEGHNFKLGVSIGLVAITESIANFTELLKKADAACYMAKDMGRNRIHVYHGEDAVLAQRHGEMQWVTQIQQALEEDRFSLYAQSIRSLDNSNDKHYELLIRMKGTQGEGILPGNFLPAAERYNLITQLDRWVIENAFSLLTKNPVFLKQINFISINLSGQSLADESFQSFVIEQFKEKSIPPNKICFEITETATITNMSTAKLFISEIKVLGCRFALDDFGSGLSSFGYLKNLSVDYLKIDGMFVKDIVDDPIDRAMVKSINEIGQLMSMQTIAEFVENDNIKALLKEIGVNYAQGYGIAKPLPFEELLD